MSSDDDGSGVLFYFTDEDNCYKGYFDQCLSFSSLFQVADGVTTMLARASGLGFVIGAETPLSVTVSGSEITVLRNEMGIAEGTETGGISTGGTVGQ